MIEITFDETAAGGLKIAKSMKPGEHIVYGNPGFDENNTLQQHEVITPQHWTGIAMDGSSSDVETVFLVLDIGDIAGLDKNIEARKTVLEELFGGVNHNLHTKWDRTQHALERLNEAKLTKEPVRIWVCDSNPTEMCGLLFVCHVLKDSDIPITVVHKPEIVEKDGFINIDHHVGSMNPEEFATYAKTEKPVSKIQGIYYESIWKGLVQENAPLRVFISGSLISVPENFYDFALRANIPKGEFPINKLISMAFMQVPCVNDYYLYSRVKAMIESGELVIVSSTADIHPYSDVVKLSDFKSF